MVEVEGGEVFGLFWVVEFFPSRWLFFSKKGFLDFRDGFSMISVIVAPFSLLSLSLFALDCFLSFS